jgi:hypothetical protein
LQVGRNRKYILCQQFYRTVDHIISACLISAKEQYVKRYARLSAQLHFNICKETGLKSDSEHWYEHVPKLVETSHEGEVTVLWNQQVQTDRTIPHNKPDIIVHVHEEETYMLLDVAVSGDRNVIRKEAKKILKYKDLTTEMQLMWNVKTEVISN